MATLGIVLGVLPLMITALQEWHTITRPFSRYKNFKRLTKTFRDKLQAQDWIFRQECKIILVHLLERSLKDPQMAEDLLKEWDHEIWREAIPEEVEAEYLGDARVPLAQIIRVVVEMLQSIQKKCYAYGVLEKLPKASDRRHPHYNQLILTKNKLKYSFLNNGLDGELDELAKQNYAICKMSSQLRRLSSFGLQSRKSGLVGLLGPQGSLPNTGRLIQRASTQIYEGLKRACQCQKKHSLHFRLEPELDVTKVRFTLAMPPKSNNSTANTQKPYWIKIESIFEDSKRQGHSEADHTLDPQLSKCEPQQHSYMHLLGGFFRGTQQHASEHQATPTDAGIHLVLKETLAVSNAAQNDMIQTHFEKDLCNRLEQHSLRDELKQHEGSCLGYLEVPDAACKAVLYFEAKETTSQPLECVTLAQIMTTSRSSIAGRLVPYEKLRLARQLATAVLQFHSTPILGQPFESNNVIFYRNFDDKETIRLSLGTPHLNVHMHTYLPESNTVGDEFESDEPCCIRNPHLFNLGILLLELAFQAPLSDLHSEYPAHEPSTSRGKARDYALANRLSRDHVSRELGSKYKAIVRKCLFCDFGRDNDLSDQKLQDAFYRDVICELDRFEKDLSRFWGG